jgi:23S rRNA G2445 N2-methylase RlmL
VFLLAWGTDQLTYRAADLDKIRRWTAHDANWNRLLQLHHGVRPKPKGKPTYHLVSQMTGTHGYRRVDAGKAMARGLEGKLPGSWRYADENASVEIWLTIHGKTAFCGLRLSDRTMRHRTYKIEHLPASLRPTVGAAMVRLAEIGPRQTILDVTCGAGTILAEARLHSRDVRLGRLDLIGGDLEVGALRAAEANLRRVGAEPYFVRWDAQRLPLPDRLVERVISNLPFGKQIGEPEAIGPLYRAIVKSCDRVLRDGGRAVLLASDWPALRDAASAVGWQPGQRLRVRVLGQGATLAVWRKNKAEKTLDKSDMAS